MSLCPLCVYSYRLFNFQYYVQIFEKNEVTIYYFLRREHRSSNFRKQVKSIWLCRIDCNYFMINLVY